MSIILRGSIAHVLGALAFDRILAISAANGSFTPVRSMALFQTHHPVCLGAVMVYLGLALLFNALWPLPALMPFSLLLHSDCRSARGIPEGVRTFIEGFSIGLRAVLSIDP